MTMPVNKYLRRQLLLSSDATMINLVPTDYVEETSSGTLNVMASKSTTLHKPLGAALAALNHLEDSPAVRRLQANVRIAAAQIEESGPVYSISATSYYSRSRSERPRQ
jgi:hypothetical protein